MLPRRASRILTKFRSMTTSPTHNVLGLLPTALQSLVLAATRQSEHNTFGSSEKDRADVVEWINKARAPDFASTANIKALDAHLISRTFLVGNYLTAADVVLFSALHPILSQEQPAKYYAHPALTRYFDHVQTRPSVRAAADNFSPPLQLVPIDIEGAPESQRTAGPPKKVKAPKQQTAENGLVNKGEDNAVEKKEKRQEQRENREVATSGKKEKKKDTEPNTKSVAPTSERAVPVPSMIDLRVGRIVDVKKHPDADGLYVEQIDLGEESGPRTVVSGLVKYIPIEQMQNKLLVAVCNLKPAAMRGVKSFAMVLCATSKEGKEGGIEIIDPPVDAKPGDRVYFEGPYENETPLEQLNPKKKIFETIQPGFITLEAREAAWVDPTNGVVHRIRTKTGICTAPSLVGASLS